MLLRRAGDEPVLVAGGVARRYVGLVGSSAGQPAVIPLMMLHLETLSGLAIRAVAASGA